MYIERIFKDEKVIMITGILISTIGLHLMPYYTKYYGAFGIFIFLIGLTIWLTNTQGKNFGEKFYLFVIIVWLFGLVLALAILDALGVFNEILKSISAALK